MDMKRLRTQLAAFAAAGCCAWSGAAVAQLPPELSGLGVPAAPAFPGVATGAAPAFQNQLNMGAANALNAGQQGRSPVLLGSGFDAATPLSGGFMRPAFAPFPGTLVVPQAGGAKVLGGTPPGILTVKDDAGPPSVKGLYTAPDEQDFLNRITP